LKTTSLFVEKVMSAEREETVTSRGCVSREVRQPFLQNTTTVEKTETVYREGCVN
jgi:hypothetical protein